MLPAKPTNKIWSSYASASYWDSSSEMRPKISPDKTLILMLELLIEVISSITMDLTSSIILGSMGALSVAVAVNLISASMYDLIS